jgi:hypothetical protein
MTRDLRDEIAAALAKLGPSSTATLAAELGMTERRNWRLGRTLTAMRKAGAISVARVEHGPTGYALNIWAAP